MPALCQIPVALIATSPKDMLDIPATLAWLRARGAASGGAGLHRIFICPAAGGAGAARCCGTDGSAGPAADTGRRPASAAAPFQRRSGSLTAVFWKLPWRQGAQRRTPGRTITPLPMGRLTGGPAASHKIQLVSLQENIRPSCQPGIKELGRSTVQSARAASPFRNFGGFLFSRVWYNI